MPSTPARPARSRNRRDFIAVLLLLLLPIGFLADCVLGGNKFLPFDLAEFPPASTTMPTDEIARLRTDANYDATEANIWFVPELLLARQALAHGSYPHWNPYSRAGEPLAAHGHLGLCNPLHWPALLFDDPADGLLYLTCAMFAVAGLLMYGLLRELQLTLGAALFGAVAFALSGTLTANGHWYMRMEPLALLPGTLWAMLRIARHSGRWRGIPAAALAALVALCWTAGFPPYAIPVTLLTGLVGLLLVGRQWRGSGRRDALHLMLWLGGALLLGLLLAAVQLLPQAMFLQVSNRPLAPTLASQSRFAFDPMGLLGLLLPDAFSHPGDRLLPSSYSPLAFLLFSRTDWATGELLRPDKNYNFTEYSLFVGTLPLLFAVLGALARGPVWRFVCLGALGLLFTLAIGPWPVHLAYLIPGIQAVPPYRFVGPACVFVAMLAAAGVQHVLARGSPWLLRGVALLAVAGAGACMVTASSLVLDAPGVEQRWLEEITEHYRPAARQFAEGLKPEDVTTELVRNNLFSGTDDGGGHVDRLHLGRLRLLDNLDRASVALLLGGLLLLLVSLRSRQRPLHWTLLPLLLGATALEIGWHGHGLNHGRQPSAAIDTPVHEFLRRQQQASSKSGGFMVARASPTGGDPWLLPSGTLAKDKIRDLHFYSFVDGRSSEPIRRLYGDAFMIRDYLPQALPDDERLTLPWWDLLGLRYLVSTRPMRFAGQRVGPELRGGGGEFFVYDRGTALPRAYVVPELREVADDEAELQAAIGRHLHPLEQVLITTAEAAQLPRIERNPAAKTRTVEFVDEDCKRMSLNVGAGAAGYLVLADTWMPGWTVAIDGVDAALARVNVCQRAVALPPFACTVAFRYRTPGLRAGLWISAAAAVACLLLVLAALRERRYAAAAVQVVELPPDQAPDQAE